MDAVTPTSTRLLKTSEFSSTLVANTNQRPLVNEIYLFEFPGVVTSNNTATTDEGTGE